MLRASSWGVHTAQRSRFNGHPPLGVNATGTGCPARSNGQVFQWAPTLGGECYFRFWVLFAYLGCTKFQWAPTLGGECYELRRLARQVPAREFQWAPTLGGECYHTDCSAVVLNPATAFQWAPTLGGECYLKDILSAR